MKKTLCSLLLIPLLGCSTASREGATSGAVMGFVGSATAAAVSGLLFGHADFGNVMESAVVGAAGGAAAGAAGGAMADKKARKSTSAPAAKTTLDPDAIRARIGDINFQAGVQLVQCKHEAAMATARRAFDATDKKDQKIYALFIEAAAAEESGQEARAESIYPKIVELDPRRNLDQVKADALSTLLKIQNVRREQGLPSCRTS